MPNMMLSFNKVDKAGDTMTGNLNLGLNSLILNNGTYGGRIRGHPNLANSIEIRNIADNGYSDLRPAAVYLGGNLSLSTYSIVGGDATDGFRLKRTAGGGQKLFVRNYGDTADAAVKFAGGQMTDDLAVDAGKLVDSVDVSELATFMAYKTVIRTGSYYGNGADNRNIDIGVNLIGMTNVFVIILSNVSGPVVYRPELAQGDLSKRCGSVFAADQIQALTSTGFQIGSSIYVNQDTYTYWYVVLYEEAV